MEIERLLIFTLVCFIYYGSANSNQYFREKPSNVTVIQGGNALLRCVVGNRQGKVGWTKDGDGIASGYGNDGEGTVYSAPERYRVLANPERGEYHFSITDAKLEDDDEYECQVLPALDNEFSNLRAAAYVIVLVPPNDLSFDGSRRGSVVEVKAKGHLNVTCRAKGAKPAAQIRWYKNGRPLPDHFFTNTQILEGDKRFTTISNLFVTAEIDDNGATFSCEASHSALPSRVVKNHFTVSVIYPPGDPHITGYDGRTLTAGDLVNLRCMVDNGNPPPEVIWYRNSVLVSQNFTNVREYTKNDYNFRVQATDNEIEFRCDASNSALISPKSSSFRMKVYFPPEKVEISGPDSAKLTETMTFTCQASPSNPAAKIHWFIDDEPTYDYTSTSALATVGTGIETSSTLTFKITHRRPEVIVTCRATNEHLSHGSKREASARKIVKISYPPESVKLVMNGGERTLVAGDEVALTCLAIGGNPPPSVEWLKKEHKVITGSASRYDHSLNATVSEYSFVVSPSDNMKDVQCRAHVPDVGGERLSGSVTLRVQFPPEALTISQSPTEFEAGKPSELNCESSSGNPSPTVEWFRNDEQQLSVVAHNSTSENSGWKVKKKLTLSPTMQDNGAVFECRAWSPIMAKAKTEQITLNVFYKPIFLVPITQNFEILEGEAITLNASAYSNPKVEQFSWQKDGSSYYSALPRVVVNGSIIEIKKVKRDDAGTYTCKAKNRMGTLSMTAAVVVRYPATVTAVTPTLFANLNDSVVLTCDIDAYPMPADAARWERDDGSDTTELRFFRNVTKSSERKAQYKLFITHVRREDTGNYTCVAGNGIGNEHSRTTTIFVRQPPVLDHSSIYAKAGAPLGKDAELTCVADGIPEVKFQWHRDSRPSSNVNRHPSSPLVHESDRISISSKSIGFMKYQSRMVIRGVQEKDYGIYRCIAENELGSRSLDVKFGKPEPPEQPSGIRILNRTHESVTIDWLPGFNGGLPQRFIVRYRAGGGVLKAGSEPLEKIETTASTHTIDNLKAKTLYLFSVQAVNGLGSSGFSNLSLETLAPASLVQEHEKEEFPVMIIVVVCLAGIILLLANAALILYFLRRHRRKKLEERATNTRLGSTNVRKIQMYSGEAGTGGAVYQRDENGVGGDHRPRSAMSDGNGSVRTVIEVDASDAQTGFAIASGSPHLHGGYLLDNVNEEYDEGPTDYNYAEALRTNSLQRHLANGVYNVPEASVRLDRNLNTYIAAQSIDDILPPSAPGPLRDMMGQEYGPYSSYQPANGNRTLDRKYSPTHAAQLHTNGRTPYAEVRPLLSAVGPVDAFPHHGSPVRNPNPNRAHTGSPILSTFAAMPLRTNMQADYEEDADSLSGDLV